MAAIGQCKVQVLPVTILRGGEDCGAERRGCPGGICGGPAQTGAGPDGLANHPLAVIARVHPGHPVSGQPLACIKDVDFDRNVIIVREAKGNKDRVVGLPRALEPASDCNAP